MMTRIFTRTIKTGQRRCFVFCKALALVFSDRIRLVVSLLALGLVIAICAPRNVQSASSASIDAPTLRVETASSTEIKLSWNAPAGATGYQIERSDNMSGPFIFVGSLSTTSFTDTVVNNLHAYIYRVRALSSGVEPSAPSNMAFGTAITFESDQLIRAQDLYDLRVAINAVRSVANLAPATWARDTLNGLEIRATDVLELRSRLKEALIALKVDVIPYEDQVLNTGANGTYIKAIHIGELQARSTHGSSNSSGPLYFTSSRAVAGEFGPVIQLPLVPVHLSVLPDRRVLFWGRDLLEIRDSAGKLLDVKQVGGRSEAYVWNIVADEMNPNAALRVANSTTNLFCSGHSFLPDGKLFVAGGHRSPHFDKAGEAHTNIFDYANNTWTQGPLMNYGRWYPFNVTLGTGETLVMSGDYWSNEPGPPYNPYDPNVIPSPTPSFANNFTPQVYTPGQGLREMAPQTSSLTKQPYVHLTSKGKVFQGQSGFSGVAGVVERQSRRLDPKANAWEELQSTIFPHSFGSSVLLGDDQVLLVGGFDNLSNPTRYAESMDVAPATPVWAKVQPMKFARTYHTATVLPDGKVLVTGGVSCKGTNNIESSETIAAGLKVIKCSAGQVMTPELWDPTTGQWTMMAPQHEIRAYHSIAALLPDGRVLVGGGGLPGAVGEKDANGNPITSLSQPEAMLVGHPNVEIYSPPYLFDSNGLAARPVITAVPSVILDGETFFIGTSGAGTQPKVSLVRLPSVTHGFNQDQRQIFLDNPVLASGGLYVTAPASPNKCPPGYYMLFVLNAGVPSKAEIISVHNSSLFSTDVPQATATGIGSTWEQGVEFSSVVSGEITHVRFWKAAGEPTGGHIGRIWTANGTLLASVSFVNETPWGWQEAELQPHIPITPGLRYRVTYNIHSVVAKTGCDPMKMQCYPMTSWPLIAWGSYFSTPAGSFPTTGSNSNLFADIKFK